MTSQCRPRVLSDLQEAIPQSVTKLTPLLRKDLHSAHSNAVPSPSRCSFDLQDPHCCYLDLGSPLTQLDKAKAVVFSKNDGRV